MNEAGTTFYKNPFSQYLGAVVTPAEAFRDLRARSRWLFFILLTIVVAVVCLYFVAPYNIEAQREVLEQIIRENREVMPPEQLARLEEYRDTIGTGFMGQVFPYLAVAASYLIYLLIVAAGLNVGVGFTGEKLGFRGAVSIASLATVTMAVSSVVMLALILFKGDVYVGTNLGLLFPRWPTEWYTRVLKGFASQVDLFAAWNVFLLTVGVREATGLSTKRAFKVVFILWLLWAALMTALSYFGLAM